MFKKINKEKINKTIEVFGIIIALLCFVMGIFTQLHDQNTIESLLWVLTGAITGASRIEVR